MWIWVAAIWLVCAVLAIFLERILERAGQGVWDSEDRTSSVFAYGLIILFAPVVMIIALGLAIIMGPARIWGAITKKPVNPFKAPETEWVGQDPDSFVVDLVRRRQTRDPRLKSEDVGNWMQWQFGHTPDAMILDVVMKYASLNAAGVADNIIWKRLEAHRSKRGEVPVPFPCELTTYVEHRLTLEDPEYLGLGLDFIEEQIGLCKIYTEHRLIKGSAHNWPPVEWLDRRLTPVEIERLLNGLDPIKETNSEKQEAYIITAYVGDKGDADSRSDKLCSHFADLKFLMLPGDELWTFSSPREHWKKLIGRRGIVLMRDGRSVGHVVTTMN